MENTGSFGAAIGGGQEIAAAMQRRGMGAGTGQQMSPAAASGGVPMPTEMEQAQAALPQTGTPTAQPPDSELKIALEALGGFVKSEGSLRRDMVKMQGMGGI